VVLPPAQAVTYHGAKLDEAHLPHNFALTELRTWSADEISAIVEEYESLVPAGAWPNWLLGDHDFSRIVSRVGPERMRVVHMLLLTLRGTPTWYYGDELGLPDANLSLERVTLIDPQAASAPERDRLRARRPMQWSPGPHAGFSPAEPWLPIASEDPMLTVDHQRSDPGSTLSMFRSLLELRRRTPALAVGTYRTLPAPPDVFAYERRHPEGAVEIHLNFGDRSREVAVRRPGNILLSTTGAREPGAPVESRATLRPHEGVIVGRILD
jgi:alpha-glucosidase